MRRRSAFALAFVTAATLAPFWAPIWAQAQDDPPPPANLYTLHVYANLMQFPTVVLGTDLKPLPPVPRDKFNITIDGGPIFHPTKMRIEGDDPISLAVLLDDGGDQKGVLRAFAESFPQVIPSLLHPRDRVSIYTVDCTLMRTLKEAPAVDPALIAQGIANAFAAPGLHGKKTKPACGYKLHLWDAMSLVAHELGDSSSRRVLLVVSLGRENGSTRSLALAAEDLSGLGVAAFALRDNAEYNREIRAYHSVPVIGRQGMVNDGAVYDDDLFSIMCGRNGGMILDAWNPGIAQNLRHLVELLRGRYIIEYPRPEDIKAALHSMDITVAGTEAFIRPTGSSSPIPDPAILNDPNTLPSTPSPAKVGTHHHKPSN